jgi:hypothetical protein
MGKRWDDGLSTRSVTLRRVGTRIDSNDGRRPDNGDATWAEVGGAETYRAGRTSSLTSNSVINVEGEEKWKSSCDGWIWD